MNGLQQFVLIGSRVINRDEIATIDHNFRQSMTDGGQVVTLITLRETPGAGYPAGYQPFEFVSDPEARKRLLSFCGSLETAGDLEVIERGVKWGHTGTEKPTPTPATGRTTTQHKVSAVARKNMAAAQNKRWAEKRAEAGNTSTRKTAAKTRTAGAAA